MEEGRDKMVGWIAELFWWADPESGVGVFLASHIMPFAGESVPRAYFGRVFGSSSLFESCLLERVCNRFVGAHARLGCC